MKLEVKHAGNHLLLTREGQASGIYTQPGQFWGFTLLANWKIQHKNQSKKHLRPPSLGYSSFAQIQVVSNAFQNNTVLHFSLHFTFFFFKGRVMLKICIDKSSEFQGFHYIPFHSGDIRGTVYLCNKRGLRLTICFMKVGKSKNLVDC